MRKFISLKFAASSNFSNPSIQQISQPSRRRIFSTLTNPCRHNCNQTKSLFNFSQLTTPTPHRCSPKFVGFFSNPLLPKQFLSNFSSTHFRVSTKDRKVGFLTVPFSKGFSGFSSNFGYNARSGRSWLNQLSADNILFGLIIANTAVFMAWSIVDKKFMSQNFMISLDNFKNGRVHTMLTSAFSHINVGHMVSNMVGLYFFGRNIARTFGNEFLVKLYIAGAIGGSVFYLVHQSYLALSTKGNGMGTKDPSRIPALGASGAVDAIMLLYIFLNPRATIYLEFLMPVPAMFLGIFLIGKDAWRVIQGDSDISGALHLGGLAVAAIAYARVRKGRF